ncbi:hypothetical protein HY634_01445, partial [Candidatus Uhrbacteria bacterium]|nr:hypothetical protein [Candidatus Uhrbacteria bacterium]
MASLFDDLQKLPQAVRDHLYGEDLEAWYSAAQDRWVLSDEQRPLVEEAALDVYLRKRTLDQFMQRLQEIIGDVGKTKTIVLEILGNDFLKIEDYLGIDIPAYIKHLGGDPALFVKEIPVMEVVRGVLAGIGTAPADPVIAKRLETSITAYLSGIRDAMETKDVLMRSIKVGGVGLDAATADRITNALDEKLRALQKAGVILRKGDGKPPEQSTFHLVKPTKTGLMQPEDEEEIDRLRVSAPEDAMREQLRGAVDRVVQKTGAKFKSDDVSRRFRTAIEARLRDIRDYQETLDLFTRSSFAGGFGIGAEQAKKVLRVVEDEVRVLHGKPTAPSPSRSPSQGDGEKKVGDLTQLSPAPTTPVLPKPPTSPALPSPPTPQVAPRQAGGQMPVAVLVHPVPPVSEVRSQ